MRADVWAKDVLIDIDDGGTIACVLARSPEDAGGAVIPGTADARSHAFRRAVGGPGRAHELTEEQQDPAHAT